MDPWKWGDAWKNDKLYHFEKGQIVVMRLWPDMLAWRRTKTKFWAPTRRYADQFFCSCHTGLYPHPLWQPIHFATCSDFRGWLSYSCMGHPFMGQKLNYHFC